ncbi:MAG TPA: hypothetical protein VKM93_08255 [Terriglobia bacterium]|nr:hypothetical protein [Terriglobia bacterium]
MKRSRIVLVLTALPSLATLPYGRQWFLWSVGPLEFYWPLLPMSLAVLALSVAAFLSARPLIRILFWVAVLFQFLSLLVASMLGFPAEGVPLTFSGVEQSILVASEYFYLLSFLALLHDRPWRGMRWKGWRALIAAPTLQIEEPEEQGGTEPRLAPRRWIRWKGWRALIPAPTLQIEEPEQQGGTEPRLAPQRWIRWRGWRALIPVPTLQIEEAEEQGGTGPRRALRRWMRWKGWRAFSVAPKLQIDVQEEQGLAEPGRAPLPKRSTDEEQADSHRGGEAPAATRAPGPN